MFRSNKKNVSEFKHKNNTPLLLSNSKGEKDKHRKYLKGLASNKVRKSV